MRITESKLRQIIREEISRATGADERSGLNEAFGMDPLGRMAQRAASSWSKKGGGLDIRHGKGPDLGARSAPSRAAAPSYSREAPAHRSMPKEPEHGGEWAGKYANTIVSPYGSDERYTLPEFIESGAWREEANFDQFPDDDSALQDRLTWVGVMKGGDITDKDASEIVRLWNERESGEYEAEYSGFDGS